jgi:hypothetical protein
VELKRPQQGPQLNYGHDLPRDLRKAGAYVKFLDTLASNRYLWHAVTQQKNVHYNAAGGGYAWLESEQLDQDSERPLPSLSSYDGFLVGLGSLSITSSLSLLSNLPPLIRLIASPSPQPLVRSSHPLAEKAELASGRKVYSRYDRRLNHSPPLR